MVNGKENRNNLLIYGFDDRNAEKLKQKLQNKQIIKVQMTKHWQLNLDTK